MNLENIKIFAHAVCDNNLEKVNDMLSGNIVHVDSRYNFISGSIGTACHYAVRLELVDMLSLLLTFKPNLAIKTSYGFTCLELVTQAASGIKLDSMLRMLLKAGAPTHGQLNADNFCRFAATGTDAIQLLIDCGVDLRNIYHSRTGYSALHFAVANQLFLSAVHDMLVNIVGIDIDKRTHDGETALRLANRCAKVDMVRWLISNGANVNSQDNDGGTVLHFVRHPQSTLLCLAAGASVSVRTNDRLTPMMTFPSVLQYCSERKLTPEWRTVLYAMRACGADMEEFRTALYLCHVEDNDDNHIVEARRLVDRTRLDFVRLRALNVCIGLQSLHLDALQLCEILQFACGAISPLIPFHHWWKIATTVKHYCKQ